MCCGYFIKPLPMIWKNKIIIFSIPLLFFIVVALLVILTGLFTRLVLDQVVNGQDADIKIYRLQSAEKIFVPKNDGLNMFSIFLKNANLRNKNVFVLTIFDQDVNPIRKVIINGKNIGDGEGVRFKFDPITNSANQKYTLQLSAPDTEFSQAVETKLSLEAYYKPQSKLNVIMVITRDFLSNLEDWQLLVMLVVIILGARFWATKLLNW